MKTHESYESVPGILRPFKVYVEEKKLPPGAQIVYYGVPGTCTPFIELLGFAIRSFPLEQVFVPLMDESKAKKIRLEPDVGMQVTPDVVPVRPSIVVLMGGLSMPNSGITAAMAKQVAGRHPGPFIGVCFMKMFQKTGWLNTFSFDLLIDANIAPVDVWKES